MITAGNFFTEQDEKILVDAITRAELKTSGEIRVHLENFCFGDALKAAKRTFNRLGMDKTNERNGILIYIAVMSRKIAVVGDVGIHQKLGTNYWNLLVSDLIKKFKINKKAEALAEAIVHCGEQLGKHFPRSVEDSNELENTISR